MTTLKPTDTPPKEAGKAYALGSLCGEVYYIPFSKSAMRLLVTGEVSEGAIALVSTGGSKSDPIGFHYHREAHDVFLCLKGHINIWADDQARTMGPGDFASVPPGITHQYQIVGDHSEFIGIIVPGGWEEFFRFLGEPYAGAMWPMTDDRNPMEVLIPRLKEAAERFDMVPQPHLKSFEIQPWADEWENNALPGAVRPYFLRAGNGPAYQLGGSVVRVLASSKESGGRFAIGSLEGSSFHRNEVLAVGLVFPSVHHAFHVVEGTIEFHVDGVSVGLTAAETLYVPKGKKCQIRFVSRYAKTYVFASGGGLVELFVKEGSPYSSPIIPETEALVELGHIQQVN
ncbi:RmlC-like cupin domain-containing protein [Aspergillus caelatus]|uniref:RmlC-like cupin domain-containing protein n=1 Tax=Aspergillus caelatus TaxID=61420 RepID=A0A5N7AMB4_9EURO|nr:RmlC-like cupin domain-containing protein [Aspergillus caelatus]KAE8370138.1 RmlC-like cupin domain-containing protein [Aspergillus caelatus]